MIKSITLKNFRKFKDFTIDTDAPIVVITGNNAQGKSTILEAIHLITNGKSPWAKYDDIYNNEEEEGNFRVEIIEEKEGEERELAIYRDQRKRNFQIDGHNTTTKKFFSNQASTIFSPEQIEILMISPSKRRDFIDDLVSKIDIEYSDILSKFRKTLRQRNAYLKKLSKRFYETGKVDEDDQQLNYWTQEFVTYSSLIISKRSSVITDLGTEHFRLKYRSSLKLNLFEDLIKLEELEKAHLKVLKNDFRRDVAMGHTQKGAHRDDWAIFNGQDVKRFGSRGQKRVAIGELIFRAQEIIANSLGFYPILLLDDIGSELDEENTEKILSKDVLGKQQVFLTTIDKQNIPTTLEAKEISLS